MSIVERIKKWWNTDNSIDWCGDWCGTPNIVALQQEEERKFGGPLAISMYSVAHNIPLIIARQTDLESTDKLDEILKLLCKLRFIVYLAEEPREEDLNCTKPKRWKYYNCVGNTEIKEIAHKLLKQGEYSSLTTYFQDLSKFFKMLEDTRFNEIVRYLDDYV